MTHDLGGVFTLTGEHDSFEIRIRIPLASLKPEALPA